MVGRSLAIGAATGGRSFSGIAAVSLSSTRDERPLGNPVAKVLVGLLAVGELVLDKSPKAPNRLEPPGLAGRIQLDEAYLINHIRDICDSDAPTGPR